MTVKSGRLRFIQGMILIISNCSNQSKEIILINNKFNKQEYL